MADERNVQFGFGYLFLLGLTTSMAISINRDKIDGFKANLLVEKLREELFADQRKLKEKETELLQRIAREELLLEAKQQSDSELQSANQEKLLLRAWQLVLLLGLFLVL